MATPQRARGPQREPETGKRPFDIHSVLARIREAVRPFPKAAMFQLADEGYTTVFQQLVACIISIRTRDEATVPIARRLFARASSPEELARLTPEEIDALIAPSTFHEPKARQIHAIAVTTKERYGGVLPPDAEVLTSFSGVGPKCANLALGVAAGQSRISVDIHVHRVTNRWGYVSARSPEQTMAALEKVLPKEHWAELNPLLVPFGKNICTGERPHCSTCPVLDMCRQVGVTSHR